MDAIYKTNRYKLPLLIITGITSLNTSFYVAFAFMSSENTSDYEWVMEQLRELYDQHELPHPLVILTDHQRALIGACVEVFPEAESLLCIWHVEKNVEKNCRKYFHTAEDWDAFYAAWGRVMYAKTLDEFTSEWEGLVDVYNPRFALAVCYLEDELIRLLKRKFVTYWTNQHLYFGNRATSRGECNNGRLK